MPVHPLALSTADRPLALAARGDVTIVRVEFAGQPTFVVRDPLALTTVQLSAEERFLFEELRTETSLAALRRAFEREFAPRRVTHAQLHQFLATLHQQGLLVGDRPGQGPELQRRETERRRAVRWHGALSLLALRLGAIDAGPVVDRLARWTRPLFSPVGVAAYAILVGAAAALLAMRGDDLAARLPTLGELFAPRRLPLWLATVAAVKVLHELGHAVTLRRYGGECREIGVMLLAGVPSLYCDASDAWQLPAKGRRMLVSAAGMLVELALAATALLVWQFTQPGAVNLLALAVAVVASVNTLAINANPLLRYDGYYLLSDWLEVPNLGARSRRLAGGFLRRWLLGERTVDEPLLAPGKRRVLVGYATASMVYGLVVLALVIAALLVLAAPYRAEGLVYAVAGVAALGIALGPLRAIGRVLCDPSLRRRLRWPRAALAAMLTFAAAWGVWRYPVVRRVEAPIVSAAAETRPVFVTTAGAVRARVQPGDEVAAGDVLAALDNPELELALAAQEGQVALCRTRVEQLRTLRSAGAAAGTELPLAMAELADAEAQLAERRRRVAELELRAPTAGRVVAPPRRSSHHLAADRLPTWTGTALEPRNAGAWVEPGTPLAVIVPAGESLAWAALEPADVVAVAPGQQVRLVFDQAPLKIVTGEVRRVTRRIRNEGESPERSTTAATPTRGSQTAYVAEISIDGDELPLAPSARGTAKIEIERSTLGAIIRRELAQLFRLPW
ncbi:MAG: HlyD family efflux transporter periplasmic adaptor subunit [Pirellulales bacterium]|nr:HlyD family efflux transporter periplasmic adaptor subunit [Pirellulales bacterium]